MSRSNPVLLIVAVCLLPLGAAAKVQLTLTPAEAPIRINETGDFTAVVTGNVSKTVKLQVCDGFGQNCVTGGSTTLGTIAQVGTDSNNNPIARYIAPATLPPTLACQVVVLGCRVKVQAILKYTKNGRRKKLKKTATVVLAAPGVIRRASVANDGSEADDGSFQPRVSVDGRHVVFGSTATNLLGVGGDANDSLDIFLRDTCGELESCSPTTIRVSLADDGSEANDDSAQPGVSADGRFVAFQSAATNLTAQATGGFAQIYVRNTCLGAGPACSPSTTMVSRATDGTVADADNQFPAISADGRYVAFLSDATNLVAGDVGGAQDAFVRDTCAGVPTGCAPSTTRVSVADNGSEGNSDSGRPSLSADGRLAVFASGASNLIGSDTNAVADVFVRDTCFGASGPCTLGTTRVSLANDGSEANLAGTEPAISADGRFVTFASSADNLVGAGNDTNGAFDVFVRDTCFGASGPCTPGTTRVSVATDGTEGDFHSGLGFFGQAISADGRFISFHSFAGTLVGSDFNSADDIFVRDTCAGTAGCTPMTVRVSTAVDGAEGDGTSIFPHISPDGRFVVFQSGATNLLGGGNDTNAANDIIVSRSSFVRPPLAYVAITAPNNVYVLDTGTNTVVDTTGALSGIDDPLGIALTPDGTRAYVTLQFSDSVSVINTLSNTVMATIPVGNEPIYPAITPDGTRVYLANAQSNDLSVIDTGTNTVSATLAMGTEPLGVAITADGKKAYVSNFGSNEIKIIDTDPASGTFHTVIGTFPVSGGPSGLLFSPDGTRLYVDRDSANAVAVYNTANNSLLATIPVGTQPMGLMLTPDGSRLYVANYGSDNVSVINTATNSVIATIPTAPKPQVMALVPESLTIYLTHDTIAVGTITVIDVASNTVKTTIPTGASSSGIALRMVR